ncbi:hypothetical protein HCH52_05270 [Oscillospiraceae bacterium HV4-5-C5C]|nr:hypothetical protein [Oscillospiraceae bacterium HV4-5-C5C]
MEYPYLLMLLQELLAAVLLVMGLWIRLGRHNVFQFRRQTAAADVERKLTAASRQTALGFFVCSAVNLLLPLLYFWQGNWGSVIAFFAGIGVTALFLLLLLTVFEPYEISRSCRRRKASAGSAQTRSEA